MSEYKEDILKNGFEQKIINLPDDYEGKVIATLVRHLTDEVSHKAVLYIHGFNDYFFQESMALRFNKEGFNFYALDLRKYGRSYLKHQKFNDVRDVNEYFTEIQEALELMKNEGNEKVLLSGHSTGGLIVTLFANEYATSGLFDALFLNSPFYEFNKSRFIKNVGLPIVSCLAKVMPKQLVSGGFSENYGKSLHQSEHGEWDYNLDWKPHIAPKINMAWIRAIRNAHIRLKKGLSIPQPILLMHSARSSTGKSWSDDMMKTDAILNVKDIYTIGKTIQGDVTIIGIEGGMHDLVLSPYKAREEVYTQLFSWLRGHGF